MSMASSVLRPSWRASKKADRLTCRKAVSNCLRSSERMATFGVRTVPRAARTITPVRPGFGPEGNGRSRPVWWLGLDRFGGGSEQAVHHPPQKLSECRPFFRAQLSENLPFQAFTGFFRAGDRSLARFRDLDQVAAPVVRVAFPD